MTSDYRPSIALRNGHVNTIYSTLFGGASQLVSKRETLELPDGDFLDIDWVSANNDQVLVVFHGLEGSGDSVYMQETAAFFHPKGWDVVLVNHRGCSGRPNRKERSYHSGVVEDVSAVLHRVRNEYDQIALLGYSLGGNVVLKAAAELPKNSLKGVLASVGVSVPCDLAGAATEISKPKNFIYNRRFLKRLKKKMSEKSLEFRSVRELMPDIEAMKDITSFDEVYTAPFHGFHSASDYYKKASSGSTLHLSQCPVLLLNAKDDPFLSPSCFPQVNTPLVQTCFPEYGGHVGFYRKSDWLFPAILEYLQNIRSQTR